MFVKHYIYPNPPAVVFIQSKLELLLAGVGVWRHSGLQPVCSTCITTVFCFVYGHSFSFGTSCVSFVTFVRLCLRPFVFEIKFEIKPQIIEIIICLAIDLRSKHVWI